MHTNGNGRSDERQNFERGLIELMPFTRAFARTLCGNAAKGDELAQEALIKAWKARGSFIPNSNLKAWLFTILRNVFYSERRQSWRQVEWDQNAAERMRSEGGEERAAESWHDFRRMIICLSHLNEDVRDSIIGITFLGMEYKEVAEIVGCPLGTTKSRFARGRRALLDMMEDSSIVAPDRHALRFKVQEEPRNELLYRIRKTYHDAVIKYEVG